MVHALRTFGLTDAHPGNFVLASTSAVLVASPLLGWPGDRLGRKVVLLVATGAAVSVAGIAAVDVRGVRVVGGEPVRAGDRHAEHRTPVCARDPPPDVSRVGRHNPRAVVVAPWAVESYPDEAGFRQRAAATVPALAQQEFAKRSLALSKCPDTRLPVRTFAVEGEEIVTPYTGRRYLQGPTSYFGPKARGADGRITRFGGDPMKFELPPAMARLLVEPTNVQARAFLSIPGNMVQQYHFACVNWCRFYPLLADTMGETWKKEFMEAIATYREGRKPSDGEPEYTATRPFAHDLVGEENEFFGGNVGDGGTENHKTMWRTSGLLYSQILGPDAKVSGYAAAEAERITTMVLTRGWQDILKVGNGEWDSSSYYPWQIRGFVSGNGMQRMDQSAWAFVPRTSMPVTNAVLWLHQATTKYRPNRVVANIITKKVPLPFEAPMARPAYHLKDKNAFQETFYCADGFALGSVAMPMEDNPGQQTVWSLGGRHPAGTFVFGGGQPKFRSPEGHSPYTQVIQNRGALVLLTAGKELVSVTATQLACAPPRRSTAQRWIGRVGRTAASMPVRTSRSATA